MNFRMDFGGSTSSIESSYLKAMHKIYVLVADHDVDVWDTRRLLEICQYEVEQVSLARDAIDVLRAGKTRFHLIIANINSPDGQFLQLVQQAATTETPIILTTSWNEDPLHVRQAIELGAFMYLAKPLKSETMANMWQHLLREDLRRKRDAEIFAKSADDSFGGIEKERRRRLKREGDDVAAPAKEVKRKECTEWTAELHDKFMAAVQQLGEGRCFPKEILELMNVPGLTRMQVASHLQKCRNDNWRSPEERRAMMNQQQNNSSGRTPSREMVDGGETNTASPQNRPRRFGSMPKILSPLSPQSRTGTATNDGAPPQAQPVVDDFIPFPEELWVHNFHPQESASDMNAVEMKKGTYFL